MPTAAQVIRFRSRWTLSLSTAFIAATIMPHTVSAQERSAALEEIIVTAQRREESLQTAPLSVTVLSDITIEEMGISDISDLTQLAPNVQIPKTPGGSVASIITIRGLASGDHILTSDPKSSLYLDGVLVAKSIGSLLDMVDTQRIEILRGPQGTLFGRNSNGGAINVISKKPQNELDFSFNVDVGNFSRLNTKTMLNVPLYQDDSGTNSLAARISFSTQEVDGWIDNPLNGDDFENPPYGEDFKNRPNGGRFGDEDRWGGRVALRWSTDTVEVNYSYDKTKWDDIPPAAVLELSGDPKNEQLAGLLNNLVYPIMTETGSIDEFVQLDRPSKVESDIAGFETLDVEGHNLTAAIDIDQVPALGDITLTSISAYRETENASLVDIDGTPLRFGHFHSPYRQQDQFTQEFRITGLSWDERLDYVFGLFYFDEGGGEHAVANSLVFPEVFPVPLSTIDTIYSVDNEAWAAYGQATLSDWLISGLNLTLGVRYTEETRGLDIHREEFQFGDIMDETCDPADAGNFDPNICGTFDLEGLSEDYSNTSPMANLSYQWTADFMTYARWAQGFQSGGFNGRSTTLASAAIPYDEEYVTSYELGLKSHWFDSRMQVNASIFYTDNEDLQVAQLPVELSSPSIGTVVVNAGEATIWGGELELIARPIPEMDLYLNYGYLDTEYNEYIIGTDLDGTPIDTADGDEFVNAPKQTLSGGIKYHFGDFSFGVLSARIDAYWQDHMFFAGASEVVADNPLIAGDSAKARASNNQDAYALVHARITLDQIPLGNAGSLRLALWGRNLADKEYRYAGIDLIDPLGFGVTHYGEPRTYGVSLTYDLN